MFIYEINIQYRNYIYLQHNSYVSDLIDKRIDFDQWVFCVVWAFSCSRAKSTAIINASFRLYQHFMTRKDFNIAFYNIFYI
jgi:hypothetical protein